MRGTSRVERIAAKMEHRRKHSIKVPNEIHDYFLQTCRKIARQHGYENRFSVEEFEKLHLNIRNRVEQKQSGNRPVWKFLKQEVFGLWDRDEIMLQILDRGQERMQAIHAEWFWYRDFNFFQIVSSVLLLIVCVNILTDGIYLNYFVYQSH